MLFDHNKRINCCEVLELYSSVDIFKPVNKESNFKNSFKKDIRKPKIFKEHSTKIYSIAST